MKPTTKNLMFETRTHFPHHADPFTHVRRMDRLVSAVWDRIPTLDQRLMLKEIAKYPCRRLEIVLHTRWTHLWGASAWFSNDQGRITLDFGYFQAAHDEHVSGVLAHEFGHLRGYADPKGIDRSEEVAHNFQIDVWGFPDVEVVYKCEVCRAMDEVLTEADIPGKIFWHPDYLDLPTFVYLPHGKRLELRKQNYKLLDDHPWSSTRTLLLAEPGFADPVIAPRRKNASAIKRTVRYKKWETTLNVLAKLLPHEQE